jgi:hypothetical protein
MRLRATSVLANLDTVRRARSRPPGHVRGSDGGAGGGTGTRDGARPGGGGQSGGG